MKEKIVGYLIMPYVVIQSILEIRKKRNYVRPYKNKNR